MHWLQRLRVPLPERSKKHCVALQRDDFEITDTCNTMYKQQTIVRSWTINVKRNIRVWHGSIIFMPGCPEPLARDVPLLNISRLGVWDCALPRGSHASQCHDSEHLLTRIVHQPGR